MAGHVAHMGHMTQNTGLETWRKKHLWDTVIDGRLMTRWILRK